MACFLVPVAEAVVTTTITKVMEKKEAQNERTEGKSMTEKISLPIVNKLKWLNKMLWGGAILLCFEHVWHGEVVPFFPFLTAASAPGDLAEMLHEMSTVGVSMVVLITVIWIGMLAVSAMIENRTDSVKQIVQKQEEIQ